jgi:hypothetical protein
MEEDNGEELQNPHFRNKILCFPPNMFEIISYGKERARAHTHIYIYKTKNFVIYVGQLILFRAVESKR